MKICSFHFLFVPLRPKYKFDILIMKLADIRKNVVTTYHYTTIGGEELIFENEGDCCKAREKDIGYSHFIRLSVDSTNFVVFQCKKCGLFHIMQKNNYKRMIQKEVDGNKATQ